MQQRYVVGKARRRIRLEDASPRVDYSVSALIDFLRGKDTPAGREIIDLRMHVGLDIPCIYSPEETEQIGKNMAEAVRKYRKK